MIKRDLLMAEENKNNRNDEQLLDIETPKESKTMKSYVD